MNQNKDIWEIIIPLVINFFMIVAMWYTVKNRYIKQHISRKRLEEHFKNKKYSVNRLWCLLFMATITKETRSNVVVSHFFYHSPYGSSNSDAYFYDPLGWNVTTKIKFQHQSFGTFFIKYTLFPKLWLFRKMWKPFYTRGNYTAYAKNVSGVNQYIFNQAFDLIEQIEGRYILVFEQKIKFHWDLDWSVNRELPHKRQLINNFLDTLN